MPGVDEKVHENREKHKVEIPLGQNSAVQNGTTENWEAASAGNKRGGHGRANRDRTACARLFRAALYEFANKIA